MRFENLGEFERDMLAEAYEHDRVQRLRAVIGLPICAGMCALVLAFMLTFPRDAIVGWPFLVLFVGIGLWILLQTIASRRLHWALRSLDLDRNSERQLIESMRSSSLLTRERKRAGATVWEEIKEGIRRARSGEWFGRPGDDDE